LTRELELGKPKKILDIPCGFGRHTNRLTKLGHKLTGVDLMPGFLDIAKADAKKKKVKVNYIRADMRKISLREKFDRILILFTSFGYFTDEENLKVMENVANSLKKGGLLCLDTFNRDAFLKGFLPYIVTEKEGNLLIDRNSFDSTTGRLNCKRIVIRNGKRKDKPFSIRLYNPTEIRDLLNKVGLKIHKIYQDWDANPFTSDSRRMIIIARKG
jgi:SAM-dependent methyltransferase